MITLLKIIVLACFIPALANADDCNLGAHFGPVSFENERPVAALRKILAGTGISLVETGEFDAGTISAQNVSGTVGEVIRRLAEGTGLTYTCRNGVMRVSQTPHPATNRPASAGAAADLPAPQGPAVTAQAASPPTTSPLTTSPLTTLPQTAVPQPSSPQAALPAYHPSVPLLPEKSVLQVRQGDSLKARLIEFARLNQYQVSWAGDDLFARQDARFFGDNFEDVANKFLTAAKITGYISDDEGKTLNVFVR